MKGEGKDFELAECAMRRRVSAKARGDAQERTVLGVAEAEKLPFPKKERENARKRRGFEEKSTSFFCSVFLRTENPKHFLRKTALFRNKRFIFAADKTQPSLFPPQCGVHIAAIFWEIFS